MNKKVVKKKVAKVEEKQDLLNVSHISGLKVIPIETRKFIQFDWDFTNKDVEIPIIKPDHIKDAIVKVSIRVRQEDSHKIDIKKIEDMIKPHCFVLKPIVPSIQKERKIRNKKLNTDISPLDAVKVWLENKNVKNSERVLEVAENIIREIGANET